VDGAAVLVASEGRQDPANLYVALLEWTDLNGELSIDLGTARNYYVRVKSPAGLWPGPEDNKVDQVLTASQCVTPGEAFELDVQLDGPSPVIPWDVDVKEQSEPEGLALRIEANTYQHALEGDNTLYERRFTELYEGGDLELLLVDEENYGLLVAALPFEALGHWPEVEALDALVAVDPPAEGQALYVVASNRARFGHSYFANIAVSHQGETTPPAAGAPASPDASGGCQCGVPNTEGRPGAAALLMMLGACLCLRRRRALTQGRAA
jgi:hypothetical protein